MINELTVDGQVKKDIEVFEDKIAFVVSIPTHKDELTGKDVFTFIKILYVGEMTDKTKNTIKAGNTIRIYGKLDSERFITKLNKAVYNKIIVTEDVRKLEYDRKFGIYTEVIE